jgi:hypothetical protein
MTLLEQHLLMEAVLQDLSVYGLHSDSSLLWVSHFKIVHVKPKIQPMLETWNLQRKELSSDYVSFSLYRIIS